ncbi:MAG: amino acid--tRNA ligase-related protein, partial [Patescibacteria group bacterium]
MSEADIRSERVKKLDLLKEAGMEAYPARTRRNTTVGEFLERFEQYKASGEARILAGRVMSLRGQGGIVFADFFDGLGRVQIVLQKEDMNAALFQLWSGAVDAGDFVEAEGAAYTTKRGEKSLKVSSWTMLSKSLLPIPTEHFGLKDEEKKLREREIDILLNPELRAMFVRRSKFWQTMREFYLSKKYLEVETPVLETIPGGADARPFVTHHNALDIDVYLRISCGELWQ